MYRPARWSSFRSPVAPAGDPNGLDDVNCHLEEKHKKEEEEAEGAVRPKEEKTRMKCQHLVRNTN